MITIGLDLSLTHTGFVIVQDDGNVLSSGVIKSKPCGDKPADETRRIRRIVEDTMAKITIVPDLVVIENLAFMAQGISLTQLAGLSYYTRINLLDRNWPFILVAPTSLKKFITGSGKGDKNMMLMSVYKNYGFEATDDNVADGYSLAICGLALLGKPLKDLTVAQKEVIKLLNKQL